ncbi:MAG: hypothetical protein DRI39_05455 [Chloroflexi bacterium]|nr:MAG: hypothetical protein DRI39_05455 [Chloroflexota bacterium]
MGTSILRSVSVLKAMDSSVSVRSVAASVPARMVMAAGCGADRRKVMSVVAGLAGAIFTPIISRNLM